MKGIFTVHFNVCTKSDWFKTIFKWPVVSCDGCKTFWIFFFPIKFVFFRPNNFKAKKCTGEFCFKHFSVVLKWISSCNIKTGTLGGHWRKQATRKDARHRICSRPNWLESNDWPNYGFQRAHSNEIYWASATSLASKI